jgi:hypothetical protein
MRKNEHGLLAREDGEEERESMRKRAPADGYVGSDAPPRPHVLDAA